MSADNWRECPQCKRNQAKELESLYGKVTESEYRSRIAELEDDENSSFREDYELGVYEEEFYVRYHGRCERCGFTVEFEHKEDLKGRLERIP